MRRNSERPDQDSDPGRYGDRLSGLMARFRLQVGRAAPGSGNLLLRGPAAAPAQAVYWPRARPPGTEAGLIEMQADWGDGANPLLAALPSPVTLDADEDPESGLLMRMLVAEAGANRCGVQGALARLTEVLVIRLLRAEIARGAARPGLIGGLAHPRISRAIVAMHDEPGRPWRSADLAAVAGLSPSRFAELFAASVGTTPIAYLRCWRLALARQELAAGARVKVVARRLGYRSAEALARAFQAEFGVAPSALRPSLAAE